MIGWCQWMLLSLAAGNEAGLIGTAYWVLPLHATQLAVVSCKRLSVVFMRASGGEDRHYP